ncbi:hypothetical protein HYQ45_006646 [Verticillium longisporum]|uniref:NACHT-NTPase and P-loop NTPases N-terminal domain-containing protein n=2 Tax=Verticillium longisporum TaxID=100787 RepID=A0A8I2ZNM8_VERLO|nr:hypothetical protein HYQ45_006646 [Verticillium longisporum]
MALEAVGLGLGATQFAAELAVTIVKLKRLWDEVQDVPDHIQSILEELEDVDLILQDVEEQVNRDEIPDELKSTVLPRVLRSTQRAYRALEDLVESLDRQIVSSRGFRRRLVSVRVVVKKPVLEKMESQLRRALDILNMAINSYTMAYTRISSQVIISRLPMHAPLQHEPAKHVQLTTTNTTAPPEVDDAKKNNVEDLTRIRTIYPGTSWFGRIGFVLSSKDRYEFALQTPSWLAGSIYSVMVERSLHGWKTELRVHNVIQSWKDVGEINPVLEADDTSALLGFLLHERLPLLTRDQDGFTLLDLASSNGSVRTFGKLIELGLSGYILDNRWNGVLNSRMDYWIYKLYIDALCRTEHIAQQRFAHAMIDILSLLLPYDTENRIGKLDIFANLIVSGRLVDMKRYREKFLPDLSLADRLRCSRLLLSRHPIRMYEFRALLPECWPAQAGEFELSSPAIVELSRTYGCSIVHSLAVGMGLSRSKAEHTQPTSNDSIRCSMMRQCLAEDPAALHCLERDFSTCPSPGWESCGGLQTPLASYLRSAIRAHVFDKTPLHKLGGVLNDTLQRWLSIVQDQVGDNLLAYGREELRLYKDVDMPNGLMNLDTWLHKRQLRVIGITFGRSPNNWTLWWAHEYEEYAGDFWNLIEGSSQHQLPGSWPVDLEGDLRDDADDKEEWAFEQEPMSWTWAEVTSKIARTQFATVR